MSQTQVRRRWKEVDGVLLLDKAGGMTSNDALQKARRLFSAAKGGHTGTLDPMATGLLPLCFGEATKFSNRLLEADKTYRATIRFGITTTTGDAEGDVLERRDGRVSEESVREVCKRFVGKILQLPPMYSALKHQGKALYEYARQGVEIEREERRVHIHSLEVLQVREDEADIEVCCSKGTYVRTLAEDIGGALGSGAHLTALRRVAIGSMRVENAVTLESIADQSEEMRETLLSPADSLLAHLPAAMLDEVQARSFLHGQTVRCFAPAGEVRVYGSLFLGLGSADGAGFIKPVRVIAFRNPVV